MKHLGKSRKYKAKLSLAFMAARIVGRRRVTVKSIGRDLWAEIEVDFGLEYLDAKAKEPGK